MVLDNLIKDFPAQFQGKKKIEALCSAFDEQVAELLDVFVSIREDTSLDNAEGKQLDLLGDIVGLTRAEGALLCGKEIYFNVLEDDRYRPYLKYKAYKNSNSCTYSDIIKELNIVAGIDNIRYEEDEEYPATFMLSVPLSDKQIDIGSIPTLAPAGVSVLYKFSLGSTINVKMIPTINVASTVYCGTFNCGTHP